MDSQIRRHFSRENAERNGYFALYVEKFRGNCSISKRKRNTSSWRKRGRNQLQATFNVIRCALIDLEDVSASRATDDADGRTAHASPYVNGRHGSGWIRTNVGRANGFTARPLQPLGHTPMAPRSRRHPTPPDAPAGRQAGRIPSLSFRPCSRAGPAPRAATPGA